ncbi:MAG: hypothetical protein H7Y17_03605 [Chlorobia bacterium]|nr:hypothetical protein [Fimbriimonadaceae bacterium]
MKVFRRLSKKHSMYLEDEFSAMAWLKDCGLGCIRQSSFGRSGFTALFAGKNAMAVDTLGDSLVSGA